MNNLEKACNMYYEDWLASLPENPPVVEFSKRHQRKMKKLFDKMRGNHYHYFTRKTMAVMIAAAILCSLSICAFANPDVRAYIIDELSDHAIFQSLFESDEIVDGKIECGYIPEGFELTQDSLEQNHVAVVYENGKGEHFSLLKTKNGYEVGADNEFSQKTIIQSNTKEFVIYEKINGALRIVWCDSNYTYRLGGNLSLEEAIKIAENVK